MAFAYCENCKHPLDPPCLEDAIVGNIVCPECEEIGYELDDNTKRQAVSEFASKLLTLFSSITGRTAVE